MVGIKMLAFAMGATSLFAPLNSLPEEVRVAAMDCSCAASLSVAGTCGGEVTVNISYEQFSSGACTNTAPCFVLHACHLKATASITPAGTNKLFERGQGVCTGRTIEYSFDVHSCGAAAGGLNGVFSGVPCSEARRLCTVSTLGGCQSCWTYLPE